MLNEFLFFTLCAVSIWRRSWLAVAFSFLYLLHMAADPYLSDPAYYIVLILIDSSVAMAISAYTPSRHDLSVAACAGLFLIVNCYGLAIWFMGLDPDPYNYACTAAYIIMITSIVSIGRPAHERKRRDNMRLGGRCAVLACREGVGMHHQEDYRK